MYLALMLLTPHDSASSTTQDKLKLSKLARLASTMKLV